MNINRERYRYVVYNTLPIVVVLFLALLHIKSSIKSSILDWYIYSFWISNIGLHAIVNTWRSKYSIIKIEKSVDNVRRLKNFSFDSYIVNENDLGIHRIKSSYSISPFAFTLSECDQYYELNAPRGFKSVLKSYDIRDATFI